MNKMLISATQADEVRVALIKGQTLYDLEIEHPGFEQKKANIYKARVSRIEPSLEAAFIDYGADRHGFLPFKEIARSFFKPELANEPFSRLGIKDALREGQEIMIQIDKEERGTKGAALTTFISLAGSYLVLMPNNPRVGGVSRRVEGKERDDLRDLLHNLNLPEGMGLIVRTAGVGKSLDELKWDLDSLMHRWRAIETVSTENQPAPFLIYQEGDAVMRAIRDCLRQDIVEILVDSPDLYEKTKQYIEQVKPDFIDKVKLYQDKVPLFSFYQVEKQIETAYQRVVRLPSGGSISIDPTEALVSIDVNSARSTGGSDIEETAFNTNLEAAEEIARQLRLRDMGGLIVIDFIDMSQIKHQREVSHRLQLSLEHDRARVQVGHITRFGLLEMSRQRLRTHLGESAQVPCPRCEGKGSIRGIESLASSILRVIEEEASKEDTAEIQIQVPLDLATFMLNERRDVIVEISKRQETRITVLPNQHLETPKYIVKRIRANELSKNKELSYKLVTPPEMILPEKHEVPIRSTEKPAVSPAAAEFKKQSTETGILDNVKHFISNLFKKPDGPEEKSKTRTKSASSTASTSTTTGFATSQSKGRPPMRNTKKYRRSGPNDRKPPQRRGRERGPIRNQQNTGVNRNTSSTTSTSSSGISSSSSSVSSNKKFFPPPSNTYPEITGERVKDDAQFSGITKKEPENFSAPTTDNHHFTHEKESENFGSSQPQFVAPKTPEPNGNVGFKDTEE